VYVQNANVIIKFTRGIFPTLIMHEYLVESENIKTSKITKITFTRYILKRLFLIWDPQTLWGTTDRFLGVRELRREKNHNSIFIDY
jgi:hypothetical protein